MQLLKQSTAATIVLGPFVDDTDGKTAETALTISQADVLLHKSDGTSIAQKNDATSATHRSSGYYTVPLNTTDTSTLGRLRVMVSESGALPVWADFMVVPAVVYDSLIGGSDYLQVDAVQVEGSDATNQIRDSVVDDATRIDASALNTLSSHDPGEAIMGATDLGTGSGLTALASATNLATLAGYVDTEVAAIKAKTDNLPASPAAVGSAMTLASGAITAAVIATGAIDADALATDAVSEIADGVWDEALSEHTASGSAGMLLGTTIPTAIDAVDNFVDTEVAAVLAAVDTEVAAIKAKTDNLPASPAAVGSQMDLIDAPNATAIAAIQSGLATAAALDAVDNFVDTEVTAIKGVTDKLDTALEADGGVYRLTANALEQAPSGSGATAQEVWEYTTRTLTSAGSGGATAQEVWEYATRTLTALDEDSTTLDLDTTIAAAVPAASAIADAVLDEALSGHTTAGTLGKAVADTLADTNELQTNQGNWATATGFSTHSAADVVTAIGTGSTFTAVPWNAAWDAEVQSECTDALNAYDPPTKAEMDAAIAGGDDAVLAVLGSPAGASMSADIAAVKSETAAIVADTNELQTDLTNGGRLDLILDGILEDTGTTLDGKIDTIDGNVDSILADTNELQTDWANGGRLDLILDAAGAAGDPWSTPLPGAYGAGTAGKIVGDNLDAAISSRSSHSAADVISPLNSKITQIKAVTDAQGATGSGLSAIPWNAAWDAEVQSECTDALNAYDPPTKAELDAADDAILAVLGTPAGADMAADIAALPTATENADALLNRDMSAVSDTTARSPLNALRQLRNKVAIVAGTMTVYEEDDATEAWTAALTTDASAEAITVVDPA